VRCVSCVQSRLSEVPLLAIVACLLVGAPGARADELVQIAAHRAASMSEARTDTPPLFGYLARPDQPGRLPAVVILHWCSGFGVHDVRVAATFKSWGYVALALDSLGSANLWREAGGSAAEASDAYAALHWLAGQDFVDPDRVVLIGYSMGGAAVLYAVEQGPLQRSHPEHFRAAVAYYPSCQSSNGMMTVPTLILIGARDDWASADACRKLAAHENDIGVTRHEGGEPVQLVVYPDAVHGFDSPGPPHIYLGHAIAYDADAAKDAAEKVHAFIGSALNQ
jgi:dienelactone hydrolase